jgi:hypothetical protein
MACTAADQEIDDCSVLVVVSLWIGAPHVFVRDSRFVQSSDVQPNRGDPIVGLLEIGVHGESLLQRLERLNVLETLHRLHRMNARARSPSGNAGSSSSARWQ